MDLERHGHEILAVELVDTGTQTATVRRHHTLFAHLEIQGAPAVAAGADLVLAVQLVAWDSRELITDDDRTVTIHVEGIQVTEVTTVAGVATVTLQFSDPGTYLVAARHELTAPASLEVTVQ